MKLDRLEVTLLRWQKLVPSQGRARKHTVWGGGNRSGLSQPGASGCYSANLLVTSLRGEPETLTYPVRGAVLKVPSRPLGKTSPGQLLLVSQ